MDSVGCETIEMPALGRPFKLGMLYDCRSDKLVPALTLWDHETLRRDMTETPKPNSEFEIVASESISAKSSSLGVEASLKASFFGGLVKVDGSAKYLNDKKTSKHQARVTLQYKTTTKFRELTMNQLGRGNIQHPYVFEKGLATHVVTAVLYGAQAFFVFNREVSEAENVQDVQGNLQLVIKKIPCISIEGEGALQMNEEDKERVSQFSCKFHGDFSLSQSPVNFEDAVKVYQDLPRLLGPDGEKAVPVRVWLLPLTALDSAAAKLVRQISVGLVLEVERTLEHLEDLDMRCCDVLKTAAVQQFPQVATKIQTFMEFCSEFKLGLQGKLAKKLPSIRGGGEKEAELAEILRKQAASPFSKNCLDQWLRCKLREIQLIRTFTNMMKNTEVLSSQTELDDRVCDVKTAVCFVFTSLEREEPFLSALDQFLKLDRADGTGPRAKDIEQDQWYSSRSVREAVRTRAKLFGDFAEANQDNEEIVFLVVGFKDESHEGSTIYLYEDGFENNDNFEPPTSPNGVKVDGVTHDSVSLSFCAPVCGAEVVTSYRLELREAGGAWKQQNEANAGTVSVSGLAPDSEYSFRVRAVTDVGLGPASEVVSTKTSPEPEGPRRLAEDLRKQCKLLTTQGSLEILQVPLKKDELNVDGCVRYVFGEDSVKTNRTILVMGAAGAGKSTLIDAMINYILGVEWTDPYRFKLVVEEPRSQRRQTSEVTVYRVNYDHGFTVDHALTIIDTPGISRDREVTEQVQNLFSNRGVSDIHAICLVAQSTRLTPTQRYVFDSVLSSFGGDVAENIRILVTFADGQTPPVLEAIREAEVPCPKDSDGQPAHYKFNNSALFAENQSSADGFGEMFWNMSRASMKSFFDSLKTTEPKSLTLTKEVLQERKRLEEIVDDLQRKVKEGRLKLDEIQQTEDQIKEHEAEIERNKDFEITVTFTQPVQIDISGTGNYINNCQMCHSTCHYPCSRRNDADKRHCSAVGSNGNCTVCPGRCHWSKHYNQRYRWEYREVRKTQTVDELKKKYLEGTEAKRITERVHSTLKEEYEQFEKSLTEKVRQATELMNRLKEIALKPRPVSAPEHIHLLIETETNEHEPGWKQRVTSLEEMKKKAALLTTLYQGGDILGSTR